MTPRGLFLVVEALDGVGKTTLVRNLAAGLGAVPMATPGDALKPLSSQILDALGDHQAARCLFYGATVLAQGRRAREVADSGGVVVMDRYWLSTLAYARARGVVTDLAAIEALVPVPDITVLLTLDEVERVRRLRARGGETAADIETLNPQFRRAVLDEMNRDRMGLRPVRVDVTDAGPDEAVRRVLDVLPARVGSIDLTEVLSCRDPA
jgi:dTMP kinase